MASDGEGAGPPLAAETAQRGWAMPAADVGGSAALAFPKDHALLTNYLRIIPASQLNDGFSNLGAATEMPSAWLRVNVGINKY